MQIPLQWLKASKNRFKSSVAHILNDTYTNFNLLSDTRSHAMSTALKDSDVFDPAARIFSVLPSSQTLSAEFGDIRVTCKDRVGFCVATRQSRGDSRGVFENMKGEQ